jgi:hypothetical protein
MFMASVGEESDVDVFAFFLADRLGKTLAELDDMPHAEYVAWSSYHKVKQQQRDLAIKAASHAR